MRSMILGCVALMLLAGCAHRRESTKELLDTWKGTHHLALTEKLGTPARSLADGKGGQILVYRYDETTTVYQPDPTKRMGTRMGSSGKKIAGYIIVREFYVDSTGIVYDLKEKKERIGLAKWDAEVPR